MYAYTELISKFNRGSTNKLTYKLENNTIVMKCNENNNVYFKIGLHRSNIAEISDNQIVLYSCGWHTPTTKDRLNKILSDNHTDFTIWQVNHVWYIYASDYHKDNKVKFADGITFKLIGKIWQVFNFAQDNTAELNQLKHKITTYVNAFYSEFANGKLPIPSNGDCWECLFIKSSDKTHLLSHIEESYYVPSLLINAFNEYPNSPMASNLIYMWANNQLDDFNWLEQIVGYQVKKSLYRYMISKLIT